MDTLLQPELRSAFVRECARRRVNRVTALRQALITWLGYDDINAEIDFDESPRSRPRQRRTLQAPETK
jgi:hypothetical protein